MADTLQVTTELSTDSWTITGTVTPGGTLPAEIFIYENTGTDQLGKYVGVCNLAELTRLRVWSGTPIPVFGNRFVRWGQAKINLSLDADTAFTISNMVSSAKTLKTEMLAVASTTTVHTI